LLREDGAYGQIGALVSNPSGGPDISVESIIDLDGNNTRIYEAHYAVTKPWATTIEALHGPGFVLSYDRLNGSVVCTVADFLLSDNEAGKKDSCKGEYHDTFHFVLNNYVSKDNRIPPYGMSFDEAQRRNALPVPADQYDGTSGGTYNYWDEIRLNPPANADHARIELMYQGTSWEYIQFLNLANNRQNAFLGQEGVNMLDAWLNAPTEMDPLKRTMVAPVVMAGVDWIGAPVNQPPTCSIDTPSGDVTIQKEDQLSYSGTTSDSDGRIVSFAWSFAGGSPVSSTVEDPGQVLYDEAGIYLTTFSATDNSGAVCDSASITVTVLDPDEYTVGGTVTGLAGSGLVLQNNDGDNLAISSNGDFTFTTTLEDGSAYSVTILTQPSDLTQSCSVSSDNGTLVGANITDISVSCVTDSFTIGGTVSGLIGTGLILQNNGTDDLTVNSNGNFTFLTTIIDGNDYDVSVQTQPEPSGEVCKVIDGSGAVSGKNAGDVSVICISDDLLFEDSFE